MFSLKLKHRGIIATRSKEFLKSEEGLNVRDELRKMVKSKQYNTKSIYSTLDENGISFVDRHLKYIIQYPNLNCAHYISNLKLKTKLK